jgi:lysophospholipase L1-like esterase
MNILKKIVVSLGVFAFVSNISAAVVSAESKVWKGGDKSWQMRRHNAKLKELKNKKAPVVFIGDSITHYWETKGKSLWDRHFSSGSRAAVNLGFSADRTEHVLWRIENGELDGYEAKCIVLMIGTNNTGHKDFRQEPPSDTIIGINRILKAILKKQPKATVVLTAIFPRGGTKDDPLRKRNDIVNAEICKFADGKSVVWCDFNNRFLDAEGRLPKSLFPDLLHPNSAGYKIWAANVIPVIDAVLNRKPNESVPSTGAAARQEKPGAGSSACVPSSRISKKISQGSDWWLERLFERRSQITSSKGHFDIVMVGDSITHHWERGPSRNAKANLKLKEKYSVLNLGYGGDRTGHVLWRLQNGELEGYKAKLFQIMIGTNNREKHPKDVADATKKIIELIRSKHPESKIVLLPIFPRGKTPNDKLRVFNTKVNALTEKFADGENVIWVDFTHKFLDANGNIPKNIMPDYLHPSNKGQLIWLESMMPVFDKYCK